jgi:hypothetical protein
VNDVTLRLGLPLLAAGQSQKEVTHNEALMRADMLVQAVVEGPAQGQPPVAPAPGQCWLVAGMAQGDWAGHDGQLAQWTDSGWRFSEVFEGMALWCRAPAALLRHIGGSWTRDIDAGAVRIDGNKVVGARQPAIATPVGGPVADAEARTALSQILVVLRAHGLIST